MVLPVFLCRPGVGQTSIMSYNQDTLSKKKGMIEMEYRRRYMAALLLCVVLCASCFLAAHFVRKDFPVKKILTSSYDDMTVKVYMIGEPETPYGETNCRIDLYENGEKTDEQAVSIQNDGEEVTKDNFLVEWNDETVVIEAMGAEQKDITVTMNY